MNPLSERFVPKIHPATRAVEPDDPYTLYATPVAGDPEVMLQCLVQEYAWMGWDAEQILGLFRDPFYPALNRLWNVYGEAGIRARVTDLLGQMGVFRFQATVREEPEPEPEDEEPERIELGIPAHWRSSRTPPRSEGSSHAESL